MNELAKLINTDALAQQQMIKQVSSAENRVKLFELRQREAQMLITSTMIPKQYQGKLNIGNVAIAIDMAERMNTSPFIIMQNLDVIHGKPSFSSKFQIAGVNATGRFSPIRFKFTGTKGEDSWGCIAYATDLASGLTLEGAEVTIAMAKKEGWYQKSGSKWQTLPELMLQYRSGGFFTRVYAPDVTMGMLTTEENQDLYSTDAPIGNAMDDMVPAKDIEVVEPPPPAEIKATESDKPAPAQAPKKAPDGLTPVADLTKPSLLAEMKHHIVKPYYAGVVKDCGGEGIDPKDCPVSMLKDIVFGCREGSEHI